MDNVILYIIIFFCILLTLSSCRKATSVNLMDKQSTDVFRGLSIVAIVFTHYIQINFYSSNDFLNLFLYTGGICTGVFFFLSGYANYFSIQRTNAKTHLWIMRKVLRIYFTYIIVFCFNLFLIYFFNKECLSFNTIIELIFTMKLPGWINWYLKVQIGTYIVFWLIYKYFKKYDVVILFLISYIYICILRKIGYADFWWNSILCFPLGVLVAKNKEQVIEKLDRKYIILAILPILLLAITMFNMNVTVSNVYGIVTPILFCIALVLFLSKFCIKSKIIGFIGNISFEIYLWHLVFLKLYFTEQFLINNTQIRTLIFFPSVLLMSYVTKKIMNYVMKKTTWGSQVV